MGEEAACRRYIDNVASPPNVTHALFSALAKRTEVPLPTWEDIEKYSLEGEVKTAGYNKPTTCQSVSTFGNLCCHHVPEIIF